MKDSREGSVEGACWKSCGRNDVEVQRWLSRVLGSMYTSYVSDMERVKYRIHH